MILNSQIWQETIETAKAKSADNAALLRAIDRAVIEIERALYWSFVAGVLRIQSTTSKKLYVVDDAHTCEATANGHKFCKHTIARRLMLRYSERLAASELECKTVTVRATSVIFQFNFGNAPEFILHYFQNAPLKFRGEPQPNVLRRPLH